MTNIEMISERPNLQDCSELERLEIELLLHAIYRHYGHDFRNYAFSSIRRRIWHRIQIEGLTSVTSLTNEVLHHPPIMEKLFYDFSINVTDMFRDPSFYLNLRKKVIPFLKRLPLIRIWHMGCSTGEEVYSMAILLQEEGLLKKSRIYATDINDIVIAKAKEGKFPLAKMKGYTSNYLQSGGTNDFSEYYTVTNNYALFKNFLSENMIFAQHNLVTDGSINEFHLIICRNVLIYFNPKLQNRVFQLMYESLCENGFLGIGKRDGTPFYNNMFTFHTIDGTEKIYQKA